MKNRTLYLSAACLLALAAAAWAGPGVTDTLDFEGQSVRFWSVPVTFATPSQCLVSYDSSQCTASGVPFACCTGVSTGTCACSGGITYSGDVMSVTVQNPSSSGVLWCAQGSATPIPAGTPGLQVNSGGSVSFSNAARGISVNCRASPGPVNAQVIIESR